MTVLAHPVIELAGVSKSYGDVTALVEADLVVHPGEMLAVVGPSGSGKSTMLNIMGTLDRPTSGTVSIAGHAVDSLDDRELSALRAGTIGFVFQQFHLAAGVPAVDSVADGLLYSGRPRRERRQAAEAVLRRVGLGHRLFHEPQQLSGGEKQRVAIARTLLRDPRILILDEATSHLDSASEVFVQEGLRRLMSGRTAIVIAHRLSTVLRADLLVVLDEGRVVESGTHAELLAKGGLYANLHALQSAGDERG
jgi:putative ABC transport system ATP-binding protein